MAKTIQEEFLYKKVYEFSYAVSMIAASAKNKDISALMENKAFSLLDAALTTDYGKIGEIVESIVNLAGFMVDTGLLHPANKEVLARESESINLAIQALPKRKEILPDLNLEKFFSKSQFPIKRQVADKTAKQQIQSEIADKNISDEIADKSIDESGSLKSEMRQSAIMEKLKQTENLPGRQAGCRLNEIQAIFPEISERTLRYDIESLISKGLVERLGSRRNSVYKLKSGSAIIELPAHVEQNLDGGAQ